MSRIKTVVTDSPSLCGCGQCATCKLRAQPIPKGAVSSFVGIFRLVHLDRPDAETLAQRVSLVETGQFFDQDCPICTAQKKLGGDIVFERSSRRAK